jgi:hypothetical protein
MDSHWDQEQLGYYYEFIAPLNQWGMKWVPLANIYSPPVRDASLSWFHMGVPDNFNIVPLLGDGEMHFQKIANETNATYIFYRSDIKKIEIWAADVTTTCVKLQEYFNKIREKAVKKDKKKLLPPIYYSEIE